MVVPNPKGQTKEGRRGRDKIVSGAIGATVAAGIAGAAAVSAPAVLGAAAVGGLAGLIVGDRNMVFPIDMIAIPAYQAYMIQGVPQFTVYIKAGETLTATGGNVDDVTEGLMEANTLTGNSAAPRKRKVSKYNRAYAKAFKSVASKYKKKDGSWQKGRLQACPACCSQNGERG